MILTKGHSGKFKATENKSAIFLSGPYLSFGETLEAHTKDKYYVCPVGVSRIQPKIVWAISLEVHRKEKYKINVRFISFSEKHSKFFIDIQIAYDLRVCYEFDTESFVQVHCHC